MHAARYAADDPGSSYRVSGRYHRRADHFEAAEVIPDLCLATTPEVCLGELQRHLTAAMLPRLNSYLLTELRVSLCAGLDITWPEKAGLAPEELMYNMGYSPHPGPLSGSHRGRRRGDTGAVREQARPQPCGL